MVKSRLSLANKRRIRRNTSRARIGASSQWHEYLQENRLKNSQKKATYVDVDEFEKGGLV